MNSIIEVYSRFVDDRKGYVRVEKDPYKVRKNQLMRYFPSKGDLINDLRYYFSDISYASMSMNCFGECISHHIVVCRNNEPNE